MTVLHILTYLSILVFIAVFLSRIIRIATTPVHLRWELYPVPHEKGRAKYGGSRLEEVDWWTKKQHKDRFGGLKVIVPEVLLMKGVFDHNRDLWFGSYFFHFGLYIIIVNMVLSSLAAILTLGGTSVNADAVGFPYILFTAMNVLLWTGSAIGVIGSIRMFFARIIEEKLRLYSSASHYANILLIGSIYATAMLWIIMDPRCVENITAYYAAIISFSSTMPALPAIGYIHIYIVLLFLIYMPFTHMTHAINKFFTYHQVKWDDRPNTPENHMQEKIAECLNQPVTWAAPHIGADGTKTWLAITASPVPDKETDNDK